MGLWAYLWLPAGDGQGANLCEVQGSGKGIWVAQVDRVLRGHCLPPGPVQGGAGQGAVLEAKHRKNHIKGLRVFHPTWDNPAETDD